MVKEKTARKRPSMEEVFSPSSVAVIGASETNMALRALREAGFPTIYCVNPKHTEVFGMPCYPNLQAIPGKVDHVETFIPAEAVLSLLDDCTTKGVKSVRFFTAGFGESGGIKGAELEKAMLEKAKAGGFRILGPNCQGMYIPKKRFLGWGGVPLKEGPVGYLVQSGGYGENTPFYSVWRGLGFSKGISYGNALDVNECELLEYFSRDPETEIIAAYIEGVRDGKRFMKSLKEATARKPVIIYKGGMTEAGTRACFGHTASLTSSVSVFKTMCRQAGAIQVEDIDELIEVALLFRFAKPLPKGPGVAIAGQGGGNSVTASDEMERAGLKVPQLSAEVQAELRQFLPLAGSIICNPVDSGALLGSPEAVDKTMRVLGKVPDIDMIIFHIGFHFASHWGSGRSTLDSFVQPVINVLAKAQQDIGKPILVALRPAPDMNGQKDFFDAQTAFAKAEFPVFNSLRGVAKAVADVLEWQKRHSR